MLRIGVMALGYVLLLIGIVGILTPIPFGLVCLVLSFLMLIPTSPAATRTIRRARRKSPRFDQLMATVIRRIPSPYRRILRETDVDILDRHHL